MNKQEKMFELIDCWESFAAVLQQGGFDKAARARQVPREQVVEDILRIEAVLKAPVFEVDGQFLELTEEGRQYISAASKVFGNFAHLLQQALRIDPK